MSMTEHGLNLVAPALEPETLKTLERIRIKARAARHAAAIRKSGLKNATPKDCDAAHKMKPSKKRKPFFYNPANRD